MRTDAEIDAEIVAVAAQLDCDGEFDGLDSVARRIADGAPVATAGHPPRLPPAPSHRRGWL
jgi:hypothetical protein